MSPDRLAFPFYITPLLCAILSILPVRVLSVSPTPVHSMGYTTHWDYGYGYRLYIQGGYISADQNNTSTTSQFLSLDLSSEWKASNPPWRFLRSTKVESSGAEVQVMPSTASNSIFDGGEDSIVLWAPSPGVIQTYFPTNDTWGTITTMTAGVNARNGIQAAMDPNTGSIHVPFGDITGTKMVRYDVKKNTIVTIPSPPVMGGGVMLSYHSVVWRGSGLVDTYLLYGGKTNTSNFNMGLWAYDPSNSWRLTPTSGPSPTGAITGHCMIQSQDDNDIFVVFGGQDAQGISLGSIYFYDITTSVWTQGSPVDASEARWGMACAVAEGQLVVWGGRNNEGLMSIKPLIFDIKANEWFDNFDPERSSRMAPWEVGLAAGIPTIVVLAIILRILYINGQEECVSFTLLAVPMLLLVAAKLLWEATKLVGRVLKRTPECVGCVGDCLGSCSIGIGDCMGKCCECGEDCLRPCLIAGRRCVEECSECCTLGCYSCCCSSEKKEVLETGRVSEREISEVRTSTATIAGATHEEPFESAIYTRAPVMAYNPPSRSTSRSDTVYYPLTPNSLESGNSRSIIASTFNSLSPTFVAASSILSSDSPQTPTPVYNPSPGSYFLTETQNLHPSTLIYTNQDRFNPNSEIYEQPARPIPQVPGPILESTGIQRQQQHQRNSSTLSIPQWINRVEEERSSALVDQGSDKYDQSITDIDVRSTSSRPSLSNSSDSTPPSKSQYVPHELQHQGFAVPGSFPSNQYSRNPQEAWALEQYLDYQRQQSGHITGPRNPQGRGSVNNGENNSSVGVSRRAVEREVLLQQMMVLEGRLEQINKAESREEPVATPDASNEQQP